MPAAGFLAGSTALAAAFTGGAPQVHLIEGRIAPRFHAEYRRRLKVGPTLSEESAPRAPQALLEALGSPPHP